MQRHTIDGEDRRRPSHLGTRRGRTTVLFIAIQACALTLILMILHHLLLFEHQVKVEARRREETEKFGSVGRAAMVTLADRTFQGCALSLIKSVRRHGWRLPIVLLAIDFASFDKSVQEEIGELGVLVIHTQAVFDGWIWRGVENVDIYRSLDVRKFRKMELFLNPILRTFERLIFVDADGVVDASLEPLVWVGFPENVTVLMRQNDVSIGKSGFWGNEMAVEVLTDGQMERLEEMYPNRVKSGGSCWFVVNVRKLVSPGRILEKSLEILCQFRAGFRFNDQTLISLLFYENIGLYAWCLWDEVVVIERMEELKEYCEKNMHLQRWLNGKLKFMYRHMSVEEKKECADNSLGNGDGEKFERKMVAGVDDDGVMMQCDNALRRWRKRLAKE